MNHPKLHRRSWPKTLLASAVLSALLTGCGSDNDDDSSAVVTTAQQVIPFDLASRVFPTAIDLLQIDTAGDGTLAITLDPASPNPVTTAIDQLDGFSTNASLDIPMASPLEASSLIPQQTVFLVNAQTRQLTSFSAVAFESTGGGSALRILPSTPLAPKTQYLVVLTDGIRTTSGESLALPTIYEEALSENGASSPEFTAAARLWVEAGEGLLERVSSPDELALAYTFTTVSTSDVLSTLAQDADLVSAQPITWIDVVPDTEDNTGINGVPLFAEQGDALTVTYQGQIVLPQGMGQPSLQSPALDPTWRNATGNLSASNPLPTPVETAESAPIMLTLPTGDYTAIGGQDCSDVSNYTTAVFVHGILSNRSSSVRVAQQLASRGCIATVVIDHPGHGMNAIALDQITPNNQINAVLSVDPYYAGENPTSPWAAVVAATNAAPTSPFSGLQERHGNLTADAAGARIPFNYEGSVGSSGANFINLLNFGRSRDNLRQAVWDQMNLLASLGSININGRTLDTENVHMVGHSLGAIVATTTSHLINSLPENEVLPRIQTLTAASPGGQITRLLQNSPSFRGRIVGGLAANGIAEGSADFEAFLQVFQASLDGVDAINYIGLNNTPTLMFDMVGGGPLTETADYGPLNAVRDAFQGVYLPDHVVPGFAYAGNPALPFANILSDDAGFNSVIPSAVSPLAGLAPLAVTGNLALITQSTTSDSNRLRVQLQQGTHATFAQADDPAVFAEMMAMTLNFIQSGALTVTDSSLLAQ